MSGARILSCAACGGALPPPLGSRKISCPYCGEELYYRSDDFIPRFALNPLNAGNVREETEKLISSKILHKGIKKEAVLVSRRKRFIPFYLIAGKKGGVMETGKERIIQPSPFEVNTDPSGFSARAYRRNKPQVVVEEDSRVVLGDFRYIYGAAKMEESEQAQDAIRKSISANFSQLRPADVEKLAQEGEVISPDVARETIIDKGVLSACGDRRDMETLSLDISLIYYPVEELLFRFRGSYFTATFDLVEGRFLWGNLPCKRNLIIIAALMMASLLGFFFGMFLKFFFLPFLNIRAETGFTIHFAAIAFLFVSIFFGGGMNIAFLLLKTPFAAKITPEGPTISKWGEVPDSFLGKYLKGLLAFLTEGVEQAIAGKKR